MVYYNEILKRFDFTEADKTNIEKVRDTFLEKKDKFIDDLEEYLSKDTYFTEEFGSSLTASGRDKLSDWFTGFAGGKLNTCISEFVSDFNLNNTPKGYFYGERISAMFNFIRLWIQKKLFDIADCEWEYTAILQAYTKVINASVYVTMDTYVSRDNLDNRTDTKIKSKILSLAERASLITHSMLLVFLIFMTLGGVVNFVWHLWDLKDVAPDKLFVTALGSLLVLWVLIELINSEIKMLRGDKFRISIFVGVVLIAFIREVLIMTLKHDSDNAIPMILMLSGILILGFTYWLLTRAEQRAKGG